jgi:uncharacterized membrane protein HdeD (DUF308 family)
VHQRPELRDAVGPYDSRGLAVWVERSHDDAMHSWTVIAAVGLVVAAGLAAFGLPPVNLHSPTHFVGIMDPLCGITRGVAAATRANLGEAWWYNPASPLVLAGALALVVRRLVGRSTGRWVRVRLRPMPLVVAVVGLVVVALAVNHQLHAARLR